MLIAAMDRNRAIGRGNALPWHLPADLKRFKALTLGHAVLMGRRTAESIGRALPGRRNLVLTRGDGVPFAAQTRVASLDAALAELAAGEPLMVIGGAEVYLLALPRATRLELTRVDVAVADADAWFPAIDPTQWIERASEPHPADARNAHGFRFCTLERRGASLTPG